MPNSKYNIDLSGRQFARWTVIRYVDRVSMSLGANRVRWVYLWLCRCLCGTERPVNAANLLKGISRSCGCMRAISSTRHGMSHSTEYKIWEGMKARITNPRATRYDLYGGRGITICDRWMSFENFYKDMGQRPSPKHTLDRANPDGDYEPANCRWATKKEQMANRRTNRFIVFQGHTKTLGQWAEQLGMSRGALDARLRKWDVDVALTRPLNRSFSHS